MRHSSRISLPEIASGRNDQGDRRRPISFMAVNDAALRHIEEVLEWLLPEGKREGYEWVALNPTRFDRNLGSFKISLLTGRWSDFATGDRGGDLISLVAYVRGGSQYVGAALLSKFLGGLRD